MREKIERAVTKIVLVTDGYHVGIVAFEMLKLNFSVAS